LRRARERLEVIKHQIRLGTFSFEEEFAGYRFLARVTGTSNARSCNEVFDAYLSHCEARSVRARLLQRSRDERTDFQVLLTRYALERLLYRLSQSAHRRRFVLKGAMLFATWVEAPFRPTRDLDLLGYGENSPEATREAFREICGQAVVDDGVAFDVDRIEATPIREDLEYGGVRRLTCALIRSRRWWRKSSMHWSPVASPTAG
jgi:hypothetical protein